MPVLSLIEALDNLRLFGHSYPVSPVPLYPLHNSVVLGRRGLGPFPVVCEFAILTKWSSFARLETRTKESDMCASIWVCKTLMRNESEGG